MPKLASILIILLALLALAAPASAADSLAYKDGDIIAPGTVWQGSVVVDGVVLVPEGVTLKVMPGTVVSFKKSAASYSEEGDAEVLIPGSGLRVEGRLEAVGERQAPIVFRSAEQNPAPGDWGCIFLDHSKGSAFKYCTFEHSAYTIHAHFSSFTASRCVITRNEDGSRLGVSRASYDHCDVRDNSGKGLNFRQSKVDVAWCEITGNRDGIFLNEKDAACRIEHNNIRGNNMDLRLGDFHAEDVTLRGNWWGTADLAAIKEKVYDRDDDLETGAVTVEPASAEIISAGADGAEFSVRWRFKTGGFVDCNPAVAAGVVYFGSWDKKFYAVKEDTGEPLWSFEAGDCIDSSPAVSDGKVYFASWDRNVYCLDARSGKLAWKFGMEPSEFDDHRQSSPAVGDGVIFIGGFDGHVYALDAENGSLLGRCKAGGPIRSKPLVYKIGDAAVVLIGSGDGRLYRLSLTEKALHKDWEFQAGGQVNSSPALLDGNIFFGSKDGQLYCLNEEGRKSWSGKTGGSIEYSAPLALKRKNILIGSTDGMLYSFGPDGKQSWEFSGGGVIYSSPVATDAGIVYGDNSGSVYLLDAAGGGLKARFTAADAVQGLSAGPDGTIYAGSRDGHVYALEIKE